MAAVWVQLCFPAHERWVTGWPWPCPPRRMQPLSLGWAEPGPARQGGLCRHPGPAWGPARDPPHHQPPSNTTARVVLHSPGQPRRERRGCCALLPPGLSSPSPGKPRTAQPPSGGTAPDHKSQTKHAIPSLWVIVIKEKCTRNVFGPKLALKPTQTG